MVREFEQLCGLVDPKAQPLVLDSFCGTGHSTLALATRYPDAFVIGFDQSEERLKKAPAALAQQTNACLIRAEATDLWRLFHLEGWLFQKHTLFYPNPWPKVGHLKRRVHGHPVFPIMLALSEETELRASWDIYAQEFAEAATILGFQNFGPDRINPSNGHFLVRKNTSNHKRLYSK